MHLDKEMDYDNDYIKGLLVEKLAGTISPDDEIIANTAIMESPAAFAYWEALESKFTATKEPSQFLANLDEHKAWEAVADKVTENELSNQHPQPRRLKMFHYAVATSAAVLTLTFIGLLWLRDEKNIAVPTDLRTNQVRLQLENGQVVDLSSDRQIAVDGAEINNHAKELSYATEAGAKLKWAILTVPATKDYKVKLDDGSTVWLNAASTLRFPFRFDATKREVFLKGEAYFEVAKNTKVPFIVHTDYADINVHGTSFNVNAYEDEVFSASLVEGAVSAVKENSKIPLQPGQEVFAKPSGGLGLRSFDPELLSWRSGTYYFHRKPLADIAKVLVRWYDVRLDWKSSSTSNQMLTGEIDKNQPLEVVLSNLKLTSGINSKLENGLLTFY